MEMWVMAFVGISPIRMYVEDWTVTSVARDVREAVRLARNEGLRVCIVTEDTTRSRLDVALDVYTIALDAGAERVCICDTVGYSVPWGAATVVSKISRGLRQRGFDGVGIDWHGHNDRGLAVANSIAAAHAGADRIHGTALGVGERAGNAALEQLLVNFNDLGWRNGDLASLAEYCRVAARGCGVALPANQPLVGADAFRTATGVHAAAVRKAEARGDSFLAERVYSGIAASILGLQQQIEVGPASGRANVLYWLETHGIETDSRLVDALMRAVGDTTRLLTDGEIYAIVAEFNGRSPIAAPSRSVMPDPAPAR
jgi:2-isopropylmalate synthase